MPCYIVSLTSIRLKAENMDLLYEALANDTNFSNVILRHGVIQGSCNGTRFTINNGSVETESGVASQVANSINRSYSNKVVQKAASKYGWSLSKTNQSNKIIARRRY